MFFVTLCFSLNAQALGGENMTKVEAFNGQSIIEEIYNAVSHGIGALLSVAGTVVMIVYATMYSDVMGIVSAALYGASLIILYSVSSLYHSMVNRKAKKVFQICDHCSIFILIWGTYIPVALSLVGGAMGWVIFGFQGVCAIVGIVLNAINLKKFHKVSLVLYLLMGWAVVITADTVFSLIDATGFWLLLGGGLAYTGGVYFYVKNNKYMHLVWHLFVITGSVLHYFFVLRCCL